MKKIVKILPIILLLALVITMVPAKDTQAATDKKKSKVTYTLKNGTLTIQGKGKMPSSMTFKKNNNVKKVVIKKGITCISNYAFSGCKNLKSVTIPKTVKEIGWHSFEKTGITKITIPKSVKTIGNEMLMGCKKLKNVTMPGKFKVKTGHGAEWYGIMSPVKNITFNTNLSISNVKYCLAKNLYVSKKDSRYKSIKGVIYSKDGKKIIRVPSERKELKIEKGCTEFCLESILYAGYIKNKLVTVCDELVKVTIPESVNRISIDEKVASGFYYVKLKEFVFKTKNIDENSIGTFINEMKNVRNTKGKRSIYISDIAKGLADRIKLKDEFYILDDEILLDYIGSKDTVIVPEGIKSIFSGVFGECKAQQKIKKIILPAGIEKIGDYAFHYCSNLKDINLPDSLKVIGRDAFASCSELKEINLPDSLEEIGSEAFAYTKIEKIKIPKNIIRCGTDLFENSELKEAVLPDEMTKIPCGIFQFADKLTQINVPPNLTTIGSGAFDGTRVDAKKFLENKNLTTIGAYAFCSTGWSDLIIPAHIKTIGSRAFAVLECDSAGGNGHVIIEGETSGFSQDAFSSDWLGETLEFKSEFKNAFTDIRINSFRLNKKKTAKTAKIEWTKVKDVAGYEIRVSSDKNFKKNVKKLYAKKNKTLMKVQVSKNQKRLYAKIRPYKTVNGKKVYGRWTKDSNL